MNKNKIINDPVYGFVTIPYALLYDIIKHPYFQRLRRIKQLGLSGLVYPGALHTRFQHVIGAMSLTVQAIQVLRNKGVEITEVEAEAVCAAVLLHDMGHGPYSHTLEHVIIPGIPHERLSELFMDALDRQMNGKLQRAIAIFKNTYYKKFLHQLVSGQLDMDRLDYLRRDSFYTGVQEGIIGHDRIISMLHVHDGELVIEEKGIYSIEKFLIARRLMYWQVYLHKTVIAAESVLVKILERARYLASQGETLFATPAFSDFLYRNVTESDFINNPQILEQFSELDDFDVFTSIKVWTSHPDRVLSILCRQLTLRQLPKIEIRPLAFSAEEVEQRISDAAKQFGITEEEASYFVFTDSVSNKAYSPEGFNIKVLYRDGTLTDIADASDQYNITALTKPVRKYFLCYPKNQ